MKQTRNTQQRQLILRLLCDHPTHPTADEMYVLAREYNPSISRGTVYRNLNLLSESGEVLRINVPQGPDHYDGTTSKHYHFLCRHCNKVLDVSVPYIEALNNPTNAPQGCTVEWHKLVFVGLCPDCSRHTH